MAFVHVIKTDAILDCVTVDGPRDAYIAYIQPVPDKKKLQVIPRAVQHTHVPDMGLSGHNTEILTVDQGR